MDQFLAELKKRDTVSGVLDHVGECALYFGANKFSYHFTPRFESQVSPATKIYASGFPNEWIGLYSDQSFRKHDPIPDWVMEYGTPVCWSNVLSKQNYSRELFDFISAARENHVANGYGLPLYGPRGCHAYASIAFDASIEIVVDGPVAAIHALAQAAHTKICNMVYSDVASPHLSTREQEILKWVAQGKSNADIAAILGIAPDTVATYLSRIFDKLGARSRVGATVRALKLGLIRL